MNSILNIKNMRIEGQLSIRILRGFWTTDAIAIGLQTGSLRLDSLGDNTVIREESGRIVARVDRSTLSYDRLNAFDVTFEKNKALPYFFMLENAEEFFSFYHGDNFKDAEVILAGKHPDGQRYGFIFAILKKKNDFYYINESIEFEKGVRDSHIHKLKKSTLLDILDYPPGYIKEYRDILTEQILPRLK